MKNTKEFIFLFILCILCIADSALYSYLGFNTVLFIVSVVVGIVLICLIFVKIYLNQRKTIVNTEKALSEQKTQIMLSQIQPHFLYNALAASFRIQTRPNNR